MEESDALALELQDFVKRELAPYKYPRAIEFVAELPRTLTGKLQRYRLTDGYDRYDGSRLRVRTRSTVRNVPCSSTSRRGGRSRRAMRTPSSGTGRIVFVAGQVGWDPVTSVFAAGDFAAEVRQALANVVAALDAAGARPDQITRLTWYITDRDEYLRSRAEIGRAYREVIGRHFPAMSVVVVKGSSSQARVWRLRRRRWCPGLQARRAWRG